MADGKVVYKIMGDNSSFASAIEKTKAIATAAASTIASATATAAKGLASGAVSAIQTGFATVESVGKTTTTSIVSGVTAVAGAMASAATAGVKYNAQMQQYETAFTTLLGSAEEAAAVMEQIAADAAATPFEVAGLTQANQLLISVGIGADESRATILALGEAIAATGGGDDVLARMAANLQQVKNVGKATAADIKQFAMAGIPIYELLADVTGKATDEVAEMEITYEMLAEALQHAAAEGGRFYGAMDAQSKTINGQISTLQDNASQLIGVLSKDLSMVIANKVLPKISSDIDLLKTVYESGLMDLTGLVLLATQLLARELLNLVAMAPEAIGSFAHSLSGAAEVFAFYASDFAAVGMDIIDAIVGGMDELMPNIASAIEDISVLAMVGVLTVKEQLLEVGLTVINAIVSGISDNLDTIVPAAQGLLNRLVSAISENASSIASGSMAIISALVTFFAENADLIKDAALEIISAISTAITENATEIAASGLTIIVAIVTGMLEALPELASAALAIASGIIDALTGDENSTSLSGAGGEMVSAVAGGISEGAQTVWDAVSSLAEAFGQISTSEMVAAAVVAIGLVSDAISSVITWAGKLAGPISEMIGAIAGITDPFKNVITDAFDPVVEAIGGLISAGANLVSEFEPLVPGIVSVLEGVAGQLETVVSAVTAAVEAIIAAVQSAIEWLASLEDAEVNAERAEKREKETGWDSPSVMGGAVASVQQAMDQEAARQSGTSSARHSDFSSGTNQSSSGASHGGGSGRSFQVGEDFVTSDWQKAFLHYGERVMTKEQNRRFMALGGLRGMEAALTGGTNAVTQAPMTAQITLKGDVFMDGYSVGKVVLENLDDVAAFTLRG